MRPADSWRDYELLDATNHNRLERWGQTLLIRPDPQVIWKNDETSPLWAKADAVYYRSAKGGGQWNYHKKAAAEMADPLERFDVDRQPHGLQAHRRFPGAGRELGMVPGKDTAGWPSHPRAEPVRLHGRRNAGVPGRGRVRHPCGRQQGHGRLGA